MSTITVKARYLGYKHIGYLLDPGPGQLRQHHAGQKITNVDLYADDIYLYSSAGCIELGPDDEVTLTEPKGPWHDWHPTEPEVACFRNCEDGTLAAVVCNPGDLDPEGHRREYLMELLDRVADPSSWKVLGS